MADRGGVGSERPAAILKDVRAALRRVEEGVFGGGAEHHCECRVTIGVAGRHLGDHRIDGQTISAILSSRQDVQ
jgi:hypothetical protein